jgi:cysteine synthase
LNFVSEEPVQEAGARLMGVGSLVVGLGAGEASAVSAREARREERVRRRMLMTVPDSGEAYCWREGGL